MCGRYSLIAELEELAPRFEFDPADFADPPRHEPRYNIAPTQPVLAVTNRGRRRAEYMRWGLIPSWAGDAAASPLINARSETLSEKPSFREALQRRRCLIPADGFYEWQKMGRGTLPMRVALKSGESFAFAGLWESWQGPRGDRVQSCTIITTEANDLLRPIHQRMPVILPRELEAIWLDGEVTAPVALGSLLAPYPEERLEVYQVSPLVNKVANNGPELIAPVASGQGLLL